MTAALLLLASAASINARADNAPTGPSTPVAPTTPPAGPTTQPGQQTASTTQPTTTSTSPARQEEADALNKEQIARELEMHASNQLAYAREQLADVDERIARAKASARDTAPIERDREYWQSVEAYEQRRLEQAQLQQRAADEKKSISQLLARVDAAHRELERLRAAARRLPIEEREAQAEEQRAKAAQALNEGDRLEQAARAEEQSVQPRKQILLDIEAKERDLAQQLDEAAGRRDARDRLDHALRMTSQLRAERQLADLTIMTAEYIVSTLWRQAFLQRELGDLYSRCAEVLVPSQPTFWERNRKIINSLAILLGLIAASYVVKLVTWLLQRIVTFAATSVGRARFSVKRAGTLIGFAGSIVKLFMWVYGAVWLLSELGIDPARSAGAIGLIGLIMAGMFQQIVIDFVKGLDIVAGRHYNVGDFIEVAGKMGHVVDFNVKYTRIRTASGQEYNIPNSQCVPSRRFPDGYVNNYVDVVLKSAKDRARAVTAIEPMCRDLNRRIEPVRDVPRLAAEFPGPSGRLTLRYRVSVLPGAAWVVTDYFIPSVRQTLGDLRIELAGEPTYFFINRVETFRKLFSRQLSETEILRQTSVEPTSTPPDHEADAMPPLVDGPSAENHPRAPASNAPADTSNDPSSSRSQ